MEPLEQKVKEQQLNAQCHGFPLKFSKNAWIDVA